MLGTNVKFSNFKVIYVIQVRSGNIHTLPEPDFLTSNIT